MIDPRDITKFDRTQDELEEFYLFCLVVAGKNAMVQSTLLDRYLAQYDFTSAFDAILCSHTLGTLETDIIRSRLGQYTRLTRAFLQSAVTLKNKLDTCTVADLESIHGVGPKTARFFVLHSRADQKIAALDTHILRFLRDQGIDAPKGTPGAGTQYKKYENLFVEHASKSGMTVADFDLKIWKQYSGRDQ